MYDVPCLGLRYWGCTGVLGPYDFVSIVDAEDNDAIAGYSMELGVRAGAQITTMPAIPIGRFRNRKEEDLPKVETGAAIPLPEDLQEFEEGL